MAMRAITPTRMLVTPLAGRPCSFSPVHATRKHVRSLRVLAADVPVATDAPSAVSPVVAVRKYLLSVGWDLAWVDGVTTEMKKKALTTNAQQVEAVVTYLMSLGISEHGVENMASLCKPILGRSVDELSAVVAFLQNKGISGKALVSFLIANPTVLTFSPSSTGDYLEKGQTRVSVVFAERGGKQVAGITLYRADCVFGTAPVAPAKPE